MIATKNFIGFYEAGTRQSLARKTWKITILDRPELNFEDGVTLGVGGVE